MLKMKWTDKIRSEEVYRIIDEERNLWNTEEKRKNQMDWPHLKTLCEICEEDNRKKNRGKSPKRKAKG
jgi:hypothetical protein